ncbi:RICIN domain-containing protein [Bacillus thuringiensis]|nr:RICIN domain-containing protein [Bacillus thuringiensis]MED2784346.1 RICIN domain-containing protein [Bacillus thuringiensis]
MTYKNRKNTQRKYKKAIVAAVATMMVGISTLGGTASAFAAENITGGTYKIEVPEEGRMLEGKVVDFGADGKEFPVIWRDHNGLNQRWEFKYDTNEAAYQIINKADGRILAYNTTYGTDYTDLVTENQHKREHYWDIEDAGDGKVYLVNKYRGGGSKLALTYPSHAQKYDTSSHIVRLFVNTLKNMDTQKFKLVKENS